MPQLRGLAVWQLSAFKDNLLKYCPSELVLQYLNVNMLLLSVLTKLKPCRYNIHIWESRTAFT